MRVWLTGDVIAAALGTSTDRIGAMKATSVYDLVRVNLLRVGCPRELAASTDNRLHHPLVIEKNRKKAGMISATKYYPAAVVVAGAGRRASLLARGEMQALAWVERGAMEIQADASVSCSELAEKLSNALQIKIYGNNKPLTGQPWPYIFQVYPFESYLIYDFGGQKYRQSYAFDAGSRSVSLVGGSVKVEEKFVNASESGMARVQTGMRQVRSPLPLAGNQVSSRGGEHSDIVRQVIRNCYSVDAVVGKLLDAIKNGLYKPMKPDFAPVNISDGGKILGPLVEAGIAPVDFVVFADRHARKLLCRDFSDAQRSKLAKTGAAMKDGSYPIMNRGDLDNAVRAFGRSPDSSTKRHIVKRARSLGATDLLPSNWKGKTALTV